MIPNEVPIANAGPDKAIDEGTPGILDATATSDPNGDSLILFWMQIAGTPVALDTTDPCHPTFLAQRVEVEGETLTFQLTVSDGKASSTDTVNVTVRNVNSPPMANAGDDITISSENQHYAIISGRHPIPMGIL